MNWFIITLAVVSFIFIIGIVIDVNVQFDVTSNNGNLTIKVFKLPIINVQLKIEGNALNFTKKKKKKEPFKFAFTKKNLEFVDILKKNISHRIYLDYMDVTTFVILDNPAHASLASAILIVLSNAIKFRIKEVQPQADITTNCLTGYNNKEVVLLLDLRLVISFMDFVWALIFSIFEKRVVYGKQYRKFN